MADPRFLSVKHLPRLTATLAAGDKQAPTGLDAALSDITESFGDPRFLARTYIQGHCEGTGDDERLSIFAAVDEFLETGAPDRQRLILGEAGSGKTSLVVMLKLMHAAGLWPSHYDCVLLKLGAATHDELAKIKTPRKTVLLLDALDEETGAGQSGTIRIAQILAATKRFHRVLLTSRPEFSDEIACPTLTLSPFNDNQVDKYLKRRFQRMEEPNRKRAKAVLGGMGALQFRPLVVTSADAFVHSRSKTWNEFSIYQTMFDAWLDREQRKAERKKEDFDRDALELAAIKVARLVALSPTRDRLPAKELSGASLSPEESAQLSRLDGRGGSVIWRDSKESLRLSHPSYSEYLIALGLAQAILPTGKKRIPHTPLMLTFLSQGRAEQIEWRALDLGEATLKNERFDDGDFSKAQLAGANLVETAFNKTTFDNADLKNCEARGARFIDCHFKASNAAHTSAASATFDRCTFAQASLADTVLPGATFTACKIENTSFADADLTGATFSKCDLTSANFSNAQLSGARFADCTYGELKLVGAKLRGAELDATFPKSAKE